jgi:hypothetical protein
MTKSLFRSSAAALVAAAICLAGCGSTDGVTAGSTTSTTVEAAADAPSSAAAVAYLTETQKARGERVDQMWWSKRLIDYLPNVSTEGAPEVPVLDTVVVGEVVDAEEGTAFKLPEGEPPEGAPNDGQTEVPFDSDEADWQTIHATVKVSQDLGEDPQESDFVTVGFAIDPSIDAALFMEGLRSLGPAVFFASSDNAVFDYDETVNGVDGQGTMVATVGQDGTLALPFMTDALAEEFLADSPDLDALIEASQTPARTIAWPNSGGL